MSELIISDVSIHQDSEGRFCLNDLHKAAGEQQKHRPKYWLENQQTIELIAELKEGGIPPSEKINNLEPVKIIKGFREKQGTYVVKELVYAYAMWISPKFHIQVIRAYDALVMGKSFNLDFLNPITDPITLEDFNWRHQVMINAWQNLQNAKVVITLNGSELLVGKRLVKSKRLF
jgi:hypothetical protein